MEYFTYDMYLEYISHKVNNVYMVKEDNEEYNYEEKPNNYHDKLYRDLLLDEQDVVKLINNFIKLKRKIERKELEKYNSSFITKEYKNREPDVVYKIKNTNTFILIEHQSYVDSSMPYGMLEYSVEIIKSAVDKTKMRTKGYIYPQVLPIVLYTGNEMWNVETEYKKITANNVKSGVNVKYSLIDVHNYQKEELLRGDCIISKVMAIEKCKTEDELKETLEELIRTTKQEKDKEKIQRIIQYILSPIIGHEQARILLNKLKEEDIFMAGMLETNLKKERMKLIEESEKVGEKRGEKYSKTRIIKQMLNCNESVSKIKLYTNATEEEIEEIKLQLANA